MTWDRAYTFFSCMDHIQSWESWGWNFGQNIWHVREYINQVENRCIAISKYIDMVLGTGVPRVILVTIYERLLHFLPLTDFTSNLLILIIHIVLSTIFLKNVSKDACNFFNLGDIFVLWKACEPTTVGNKVREQIGGLLAVSILGCIFALKSAQCQWQLLKLSPYIAL